MQPHLFGVVSINGDNSLLFPAINGRRYAHRRIIGKVTEIAHANTAALAIAPGNG